MFSLAVRTTLGRTFSTSTRVSKDFVQELYVKELKNYSPKALSQDAHVGQVKSYSTPAVPAAPAVPSAAELAQELAHYDSAVATTAAPVAAASITESSAEGADEFLAQVQADIKHEAAH